MEISDSIVSIQDMINALKSYENDSELTFYHFNDTSRSWTIDSRYLAKPIKQEFYSRVIYSPYNEQLIERTNDTMGTPVPLIPITRTPSNYNSVTEKIPDDVKDIIRDSKFLKKHYLLWNKVKRKEQYKKLKDEPKPRKR